MPSLTHYESDNNVRHISKAENIDFIAYKRWRATMTRQELTDHSLFGVKWSQWENRGTPLGFNVEWQDGAGNLLTPPPIVTNGPGFRSVVQVMAFAGSPPEGEPVSQIESMRMTYSFNGEEFELVVGKNWITYIIAILVLVAFVAVLIIVTGGLV